MITKLPDKLFATCGSLFFIPLVAYLANLLFWLFTYLVVASLELGMPSGNASKTFSSLPIELVGMLICGFLTYQATRTKLLMWVILATIGVFGMMVAMDTGILRFLWFTVGAKYYYFR